MAETRKLAAILAADVAGYSKLAGADEERTLARLRALQRPAHRRLRLAHISGPSASISPWPICSTCGTKSSHGLPINWGHS